MVGQVEVLVRAEQGLERVSLVCRKKRVDRRLHVRNSQFLLQRALPILAIQTPDTGASPIKPGPSPSTACWYRRNNVTRGDARRTLYVDVEQG